MPYVNQESRDRIDPVLVGPATFLSNASVGELNYAITRIIQEYWATQPNYHRIAEITGVLENVKQEFYRRVATLYEDAKIAENGDVY